MKIEIKNESEKDFILAFKDKFSIGEVLTSRGDIYKIDATKAVLSVGLELEDKIKRQEFFLQMIKEKDITNHTPEQIEMLKKRFVNGLELLQTLQLCRATILYVLEAWQDAEGVKVEMFQELQRISNEKLNLEAVKDSLLTDINYFNFIIKTLQNGDIC